MGNGREKIALKGEVFEVPPQGLLDYFTRQDELHIAMLKAVKQLEIVTNILLPPARQISEVEWKQRLESGEIQDSAMLTRDLATARSDEKIVVDGDFINLQTDGSLSGITLRFNMLTSPAFPMQYFNPRQQKFFSLYLTNTAQPGKTLWMDIGREASSTSGAYTIAAQFGNKVSALLDSTATPLGDGATYTGAPFSVEDYGVIVGSVYSNRTGTLYIDQMNDGINYDAISTYAYVGGNYDGFVVPVVGTLARVRFTNLAGAAQTSFRLLVRARSV